MVMRTNVDENITDARARIQDITLAVSSWTNRTEPSRRQHWRTWPNQHPALIDLDTTSAWNVDGRQPRSPEPVVGSVAFGRSDVAQTHRSRV